MAQFDVFRNSRETIYPLLVDVQSDIYARLESRLMVPLTSRPRGDDQTAPLTPVVVINGKEYVFVAALTSAIRKAELGKPVGSLADQRGRLIAAIDLLITGS